MAQPAMGGGLFSRLASSPVVGNIVKGVGQGLMSGMQAQDAAQAEKDAYNRLAKSYEVDQSVLSGGTYEDKESRPTPREKWNRKRLQYDSEAGRIVEVG
jgi:hypothetical protein